MIEKLKQVGNSVARIDALERVTGRATYTADVYLPDMITARVLRSPHPHAHILSIDVSKALAMAGVHAILTHENCDVVWTTGDKRNKRYLFNNPVRFVGDPVAAVAAENRHLAEEAMAKIKVEYEILDFVIDTEEALQPDAVKIRPGGNLSPDAKGKHEPEVYSRGDIEKGFSASDHVFEDAYASKHQSNAQMEPRTAVAQWEGDKLTVWTGTQGISNCQRDLCRDLDLPREKVRVVCQYMGGGFGNKNQCQDSDLMAAILAKQADRPVKLEFTRKGDFLGVHGRWPTNQYYKIGVDKDGLLQAIQVRNYSGMGPYRKGTGSLVGTELYRCPHVRREIYPVYTNMTVAANFRAPAYPQGVYGIGSMMDHIAHELNIDPVEFHLKNSTRQYLDKIPYTSYGLADCIRQGADIFEWEKRWHQAGSGVGPKVRGSGMAIGLFGARLGRSSAVLRLDSEGKLWVHVGVTDVGTGAKTTMAMIAAEAMEMNLSEVEVVWGDTDRCPYSVGESGSRTTGFTGYAILEAAKQLKQKLEKQGLPKGDDMLIAQVTTEPKLEGVARYGFAAHFVEVEVDIELGGVKVLKYVAMQDSGRIVNPLTATSQVRGGIIMGIGMALHEELLYDQRTGVPVNPGYYGARVMTHLDAPEIEVHFIETEDAYGPYGIKSAGETPIVPSVAAVANAIFNATGHRMKELPISRDKILGAVS